MLEQVEENSPPEMLKPAKRKTEVLSPNASPTKTNKTTLITIDDDVVSPSTFQDDVPTRPRSTLWYGVESCESSDADFGS